MTGLQAIANCRRRSFGDFTELALCDQNEAGLPGLEPGLTVLETGMLPLHHRPVCGRYHTAGRRTGYRWTEDLHGHQRLNIQLCLDNPLQCNTPRIDIVIGIDTF